MSDREPPYSACAVARVIMRKHHKKPIPNNGITKLIKLVYICHGFYLGIYKEKLISDQVEAWHYGPALRLLYGQIKLEAENGEKDFDNILTGSDEWAAEIEKNPKVMRVINLALKIYWKMSALEITNITHKIGTPWEISVRSGDLDIDDYLIQEYYENNLKGFTK